MSRSYPLYLCSHRFSNIWKCINNKNTFCGKTFAGKNFHRPKFRHRAKISSLSAENIFVDKVWQIGHITEMMFQMNLKMSTTVVRIRTENFNNHGNTHCGSCRYSPINWNLYRIISHRRQQMQLLSTPLLKDGRVIWFVANVDTVGWWKRRWKAFAVKTKSLLITLTRSVSHQY